MRKKILIIVLIFFFFPVNLFTQTRSWKIKPSTGITYTSPDKTKDGFGYLISTRLIFDSKEFSYGLETAYYSLYSLSGSLVDNNYFVAGICIEKCFFNWIVVGTGVSKYWGTSESSTDPFGLNAYFGFNTFFVPGIETRLIYKVDWINEPDKLNNYSLVIEFGF